MAQTITTPAADYGFAASRDVVMINNEKTTPRVSPSSNETIFVDTASAVAAPTSVRRSVSKISNIYANNNTVPVASRNYITSGSSLLVQVQETWTVTDSVTGLTSYIPISCHIVMRMSDHPAITEADCSALALRTVGAFGTSSSTAVVVSPAAGISKMRKGLTNF